MASISKKSNLCDYCHQKPKFGNHKYCGKTCSQQASGTNQSSSVAHQQSQFTSTLCKQCGQKPKFQNFDFCGKNCAATWQLTNGGSNGKPTPPAKNFPSGNPGNITNMQVPNQLLGQIPQPLQAQIQAHLPAIVAALQQQGQVPLFNVPQPPTVATTLMPNNGNKYPPQQTNGAKGLAYGTNNATVPTSAPGHVQAAIMPFTCRLMGCSNPVHTDGASSHPSEYCSKSHREEAVATGQVPPCIMCMKNPRSSTNHFCSKACKDAALSQ